MAPPRSKRPQPMSPASPLPSIPLPGIAVGLFAAIAAGFAASRALRRKRTAQKLISTREIEIEESDDSSTLIDVNGTITIAQGPSQLAAVLKRGAQPLEEGRGEDEEEKEEEEECGNGHKVGGGSGGGAEKGDEEGERAENGKASEEESETAKIFVKIEASLTVDGASVEALQTSILEEGELKAEDETEAEGKGKEGDDRGVLDDKDLLEDGHGGRKSVDQQPSPALINGRFIDFREEMPDFKEGPGRLLNGSDSPSDAISESSLQEVSSVPVKPFVCTEELPEAKPGFSVALNQTGQEDAFPEDRSWFSDEKCFHPLEDGLLGMRKEVPDYVENLLHTDRQFVDLKHNRAIINDEALDVKPTEHDVDTGLLDLKPVLVENEEKTCPDGKVNQIRFEILSDAMEVKGNSIAFEGKVSIKEVGSDKGAADSSTINGLVISDGSSLPEELDDLEAAGECEHVPQLTKEVADDFTGLPFKSEKTAESVQINGKVLLEESLNGRWILKGTTRDGMSLQTGQKETDAVISDIQGEFDLLPARESNETRVSSNGDLQDGESAKEMPCAGSDTSDEPFIVEDMLDEPEVQSGAQELNDEVLAKSEISVKLDLSSLLTASKEITENDKLCSEGNTDNVDREDMSDGLPGQIVVKGIIHVKEQEIEEITRSCDANDLVCEKMKLTSLINSACEADNIMRDADYLLFKETVHQHGLQRKGVSVTRILEFLPREISFICLLIALVSSVLWYLEVLPSLCS